MELSARFRSLIWGDCGLNWRIGRRILPALGRGLSRRMYSNSREHAEGSKVQATEDTGGNLLEFRSSEIRFKSTANRNGRVHSTP